MTEICQQYPELVEVEWAIFTAHGGEVILISDDKKCYKEEREIDVEEWRRIFPGHDDYGTGPDPCLAGSGMFTQDWLDLHYDNDDVDEQSSVVQFKFEFMFSVRLSRLG
ncbi:zinc finger protein gis2 [Hordeum vulgare]|nr:zinc finger protein gis2 [Hordeum vulgare]